MHSKNCLSSWSGGKDSAYALYLAVSGGFVPKALLNMMNENGRVSRSHGLPLAILKQQADALSLPLHAIPSSWNAYEANFIKSLQYLKAEYAVSQVIFGDIDLKPHREWEEKVCQQAGLQAQLPLWQRNRKELVLEMLAAGFDTMIVSCQSSMGPDWLGRTLNTALVDELELMGIDACGENGEFHTLVTFCPLFKKRIQPQISGKNSHQDYCFLEFKS